MLETLRSWARQVKQDALMLWFAYRHPDAPWLVRALCFFVVVYALSPIDLIPDFIPVLGYVDDVLLLPGLIAAAVYLLPDHVKQQSRQLAIEWQQQAKAKPRSYVGACLIVLVWGITLGLMVYLLMPSGL